MTNQIFQTIARAQGAYLRCIASNNAEWEHKHRETIEQLVENHFPSGSGFDSGTKFDFDESTGDKLVFHTSFHHLNEGGMYAGWTEHTVTVIPSLELEFHLKVSGRNRNDIKEYIAEQFSHALSSPEPIDALDQFRVVLLELRAICAQSAAMRSSVSGAMSSRL